MRNVLRILLGISALSVPLRWVFAEETGDSREHPRDGGRRCHPSREGTCPAPTPDRPVYYLPAFIGYKELGGVLTNYQRPPPPMAGVQHAFIQALAQQGYLVATSHANPPSIVIAVRWGEIAPELVPGGGRFRGGFGDLPDEPQRPPGAAMAGGIMRATPDNHVSRMRLVNRNEIMTYLVGTRWHSPGFYPIIDPNAQELVANLHDLNGGGRYFLLISALDYKAENQGRDVLLWRAHVSTQYWGHYFDQVLGTMIATSAPLLGKETVRPQIITAPEMAIGPVPPGSLLVSYGPGTAGARDIDTVVTSPSGGSGRPSETAPGPESPR